MTEKKCKSKDLPVESRKDFETAVRHYLHQQAYVNHLKQECAADQVLVAERYDVQIAPCEELMDKLLMRLEAWATERKAELFGEKKSLDIPGATLSFQMTPGKVVKRRKKDTWETIVKRLLGLPWDKKYTRQAAPAIDKKAILKDSKKLTAAQLIGAGIDIDQHDEFHIDPKGEKLEQGAKVA